LFPRSLALLLASIPALSACGLLLDPDETARFDGGSNGDATDVDGGPDRFQVLDLAPSPATCPGDFAADAPGCIFWEQGVVTLDVPVSQDTYREVWGRARGLQQRSPDAFSPWLGDMPPLDQIYVDGISITTDSFSRHVYTLAAGLHVMEGSGNACPCDGGLAWPPYIGEDWTCETGNPDENYDFDDAYSPDVLWDADSMGGSDCTPLGEPGEFHVVLDAPASGSLEVRFMNDTSDDAYVVTELVLWVR
jgi:hypothetical protein